MAGKPSKWADSKAEIARTVFAAVAAAGTLFLVLVKVL
jgi:hypothetical protein